MKYLVSRMLCIFVLLLGVSLNAAAESAEIRITSDEWPPYQSQSADYGGGLLRIITEAFALESVEVEYGWFPWKRALMYAKEGSWDAAAIGSRTPERERDFYFSDPVMTVNKVFFHLKSYEFDWKTYDDLQGITIGTRRGFVYGDAFEQAKHAGKITVQEVNTEP